LLNKLGILGEMADNNNVALTCRLNVHGHGYATRYEKLPPVVDQETWTYETDNKCFSAACNFVSNGI